MWQRFLKLRVSVLLANAMFALWIIYNAIDAGFSGTLPEKVSSILLLILLGLNSYLLLAHTKTK